MTINQNAVTGLTEEEIGRAIGEISPELSRRLSTQLRSANSVSTHLELASAIFTANQLKYIIRFHECMFAFTLTIK